jgi:hypothetical protein
MRFILSILSILSIILYFAYIYKIGGFKAYYTRLSDIKYGRVCKNCRKNIELFEVSFVENTKICLSCDRDLKIKGLVSNFIGNIKYKLAKFDTDVVVTKKFDKLLFIIMIIYILCLFFDLILFYHTKKNYSIGTVMISIYWILQIYRIRVIMK